MKRHLARVTAAVKTEGEHANYARKYEKCKKKTKEKGRETWEQQSAPNSNKSQANLLGQVV